MFVRLLLLPLVCLLAPAWAAAQITITEADVRSQYTGRFTTTEYVATDASAPQGVADRTGGNQTYDFRNAIYAQEAIITSEVIACGGEVPGCNIPDFSTANVVLRSTVDSVPDSTAYFFGRLDGEGFFSLGATAAGDFDEFLLTFAPALLTQKLPLTMGTEWDADVTVTLDSGEGGFSFRNIDENQVDGWGMLQTPSGSAEALRIWNRNITIFDFDGILFTDTTITLGFVTKGRISASLDLDAQGNVLGGGYTVLEPATANEPSDEVPGKIALASNYPNPFNPSTTITYTLRSGAPVRLSIYDLLGREVEVLVDGLRPAGTHQVVWDAGTRPSGPYLYRLTADGVSVTRIMTLLK